MNTLLLAAMLIEIRYVKTHFFIAEGRVLSERNRAEQYLIQSKDPGVQEKYRRDALAHLERHIRDAYVPSLLDWRKGYPQSPLGRLLRVGPAR
jgi:hypothetical protein